MPLKIVLQKLLCGAQIFMFVSLLVLHLHVLPLNTLSIITAAIKQSFGNIYTCI